MSETCAVADPKRRAWCVLAPGHPGRHADSWGKRFSADGSKGGRLDDLPRFLTANGNKVLAGIVSEELEKHRQAADTLKAVLHQMEYGELSDLIDSGDKTDSTRDLVWCREQIRTVVATL